MDLHKILDGIVFISEMAGIRGQSGETRFGNNFISILELESDRGEIQAEYLHKDRDQAISSGVEQSKARVTWSTQDWIAIRRLDFR